MRLLFLFLISFAFAKPIISVSIPPQAYFVRQIAGDSLDVHVVIPPNTDEHNFELKPQTMQTLEKSDVYFTIGLELETILLQKLQQYQKIRIIATNEGLMSPPDTHGAHENTHAHEHGHGHAHDADDPHTWLDPIMVIEQARIIADSLGEIYPENAKMFQKNLADFTAKLTQLDA
ncbi:MAG: metal ABC transporter substrate-binding protein, partial [Helicobacter sp.]|nr:metal ABC transporter substrate-binding protein [Helicobacter sp.]